MRAEKNRQPMMGGGSSLAPENYLRRRRAIPTSLAPRTNIVAGSGTACPLIRTALKVPLVPHGPEFSNRQPALVAPPPSVGASAGFGRYQFKSVAVVGPETTNQYVVFA